MKLVMCLIVLVDHARQINLEAVSDDVQELLDAHNQEPTIDNLIEMHEQDIEELESLDPVQSEDRMTVGNLTGSLDLVEKVANFRKYEFQRRAYFLNKTGIILFCGSKIVFEPVDYFVKFYEIF
ncbi:hypothetical protein TNCV_2319821 [Trichonephila clavipes]|nr:hypothetical protein TNCV_2319821 [Trichonephila clavipes]